MPESIQYAYPPGFNKTIGAWYVGPKGENYKVLQDQFAKMVSYVKQGREAYQPQDPPVITDQLIQSQEYQNSIGKLDEVLEYMSILMSLHVQPFSSPRYAAHVTPDVTLPALLGYLLGLLYNQNNVVPECGPLTSVIEYIVGQNLCEMLGFKTADDKVKDPDPRPEDPVGWGHITCDGTVANEESVWAARCVKFYPLSLRLAIDKGPLSFVKSSFKVQVTGRDRITGNHLPSKLMGDCTPWELLNLKPKVIFGLGEELQKQYGISSAFIDSAVGPFLVQSIGMGAIREAFNINAPQFSTPATKHPSFSKAATLVGIGESNLIDIGVDEHARMSVVALEAELMKRVGPNVADKDKRAIYSVVAVMGSTDQGAVDPLDEVLALRTRLEDDYGVSFIIHCDAAWGGYFCSILREPPPDWDGPKPEELDIVLLPYTKKQFGYIHYADSVTIDSHKSGYCSIPAGGLCYRDDRTRFLITKSGPYASATGEGVEAMGSYGIEGAKPGAAPLGVWLSNVVIGLHKCGYGTLLSQVILSGVRFYAQWLTMKSDYFCVIPFNNLPYDEGDHPAIKKRILDNIVNRPYSDLIKDKETLKLMGTIGSDVNRNAVACNFKLSNGEFNKDVAEANIFNANLCTRFGTRKLSDDFNLVPIFVVQTSWAHVIYGDCLKKYKARLNLNPDDDTDLTAFSSTAMSPFVIDNFASVVGDGFKQVAEEEASKCRERIEPKPVYHDFVMQGTDQLYLAYIPSLYVGSHRKQVIVTGKLPHEVMADYRRQQEEDPSTLFILSTTKPLLLDDLLAKTTWSVRVNTGLPRIHFASDNAHDIHLTDVTILKHHSLVPSSLDKAYPPLMPFYLYGTATQHHVDHILLKAPNAQVSSSQVTLSNITPHVDAAHYQKGLIAILTNRHENAVQPLSETQPPFFLKPSQTSDVSLFVDPFTHDLPNKDVNRRALFESLDLSKPLATGKITLGDNTYYDAKFINQMDIPHLAIKGSPGIDTAFRGGVLDSVEKVARERNVYLSDNIGHTLGRKLEELGYDIGPPGEGGHAISRFNLVHSNDRLHVETAIRSEWLKAVEGISKKSC